MNCSNVCSDALYRPHLCAHISLSSYTSLIPRSNTITRLSALEPSNFHKTFLNRPFVIQSPSWPVANALALATLRTSHADTVFRAEAVDWPLRTYAAYMDDNCDEAPLYLFDAAFVEKMEIKVGPGQDLWQPECFGEDLFERLGEHRPDHRWLIVGPSRSGSSFHQDPNATRYVICWLDLRTGLTCQSAWNAVIQGKKYWILFPPNQPPPGVFPSKSKAYVTAPVSIAEYLLSFHDAARNTAGCVEAVVHAGETLHVPAGWWHLVVNLEATVAVTGNFVSKGGLGRVLTFLKTRQDQVSGFRVPDEEVLGLVESKLRVINGTDVGERKKRWKEVVMQVEDVDGTVEQETNGTAPKKRKQSASTIASSFKFSFGFEIENENENGAEIP